MLNLYIGYCQKLYTQHCHFLYIVNLLITSFNRTAYGIEIANTKSFPLLIFFLLIAPLMELKWESVKEGSFSAKLLIAPLMELKLKKEY